jgi:hypothetical protein
MASSVIAASRICRPAPRSAAITESGKREKITEGPSDACCGGGVLMGAGVASAAPIHYGNVGAFRYVGQPQN